MRHLGVEPIILQEDAFVSTSRINRYIGNMPEVVQLIMQNQYYRIHRTRDAVARANKGIFPKTRRKLFENILFRKGML